MEVYSINSVLSASVPFNLLQETSGNKGPNMLLLWKAFSKQIIFVFVHLESCAFHGLLCSSNQRSFQMFWEILSVSSFALVPEFEKTWSPLGGCWPVTGRKTKSWVVATRRHVSYRDYSMWYTLLDDFGGLFVYSVQTLRHSFGALRQDICLQDTFIYMP